HPIGIYATVRTGGDTRISVKTVQGSFAFALGEIGSEPMPLLNGRVTVTRVPVTQKLSDAPYENDEPALVALPDGKLAAASVAYRDRADRVLVRVFDGHTWSAPEEVSPQAGDIFRCALAADRAGDIWAFWSQRDGPKWKIWARQRVRGSWGKAQPVADE